MVSFHNITANRTDNQARLYQPKAPCVCHFFTNCQHNSQENHRDFQFAGTFSHCAGELFATAMYAGKLHPVSGWGYSNVLRLCQRPNNIETHTTILISMTIVHLAFSAAVNRSPMLCVLHSFVAVLLSAIVSQECSRETKPTPTPAAGVRLGTCRLCARPLPVVGRTVSCVSIV